MLEFPHPKSEHCKRGKENPRAYCQAHLANGQLCSTFPDLIPSPRVLSLLAIKDAFEISQKSIPMPTCRPFSLVISGGAAEGAADKRWPVWEEVRGAAILED